MRITLKSVIQRNSHITLAEPVRTKSPHHFNPISLRLAAEFSLLRSLQVSSRDKILIALRPGNLPGFLLGQNLLTPEDALCASYGFPYVPCFANDVLRRSCAKLRKHRIGAGTRCVTSKCGIPIVGNSIECTVLYRRC